MSRFAYFIDGLDTRVASVEAAAAVADALDASLDVHHPWASKKNLAGRPTWRPVPPEKVVGSGRERARSIFRKACGRRKDARFVGVDGHLVDAIRSFGVAYDFIVIDRLEVESGRKPYAFNTALFESGAPVLIMPPGQPAAITNRVVMIWSGTCQSGRALRSALPFFRQAREVFVLSNNTNPMANPVTATDYLKVHGIKCRSDYFDGSGHTARGRGRVVIKTASSMGADMLVMGAFGFNGIERILDLGRATRKLVTATPVPLLLQS